MENDEAKLQTFMISTWCGHPDAPKNVASLLINVVIPTIRSYGYSLSEIDEYTYEFSSVLSGVSNAIAHKTLTKGQAKEILVAILTTHPGFDAMQAAIALNVFKNDDALKSVIASVIEQNQSVISQYKAGNEKSINSLIGKVLKQTKAEPVQILETIKELIAA